MRENGNKKAYLNRVAEKISNKKIKSEIVYELDVHIDERAQFYKEIGYTEEEAFEKAVEQMGDPDTAGISLARLHPKGKIAITILLLFLLFTMIVLFWGFTLVSIDDGELGISLLEVLFLLCFIGISCFAHKKGSLFLSILSPLLFFCTYGQYALLVSDVHGELYYLCSPIILEISCILTGDFICLATFRQVGCVTVSPWLTYLSIAFYISILFLLVSMSVSVGKLYRPTYTLFDKRAGKRLKIIAKSICVILIVFLLVISSIPLQNQVKETQPKNLVDKFDYVIVTQSDTPCSIEDIQREDVWIICSNYDWSDYILSWDYANYGSDWDIKKTTDSIYNFGTESVIVQCGDKLCYEIKKEILECSVSKPYVHIAFIYKGMSSDSVCYETLSMWLPKDLEWQKSEDVGTVSVAFDAYNCVDVVIRT